MPITPDAVVSRTGGLLSTPIHDEIVILNPQRDNYVGLDEIGRRVWDLLAEPGAVSDLCAQLTREYQGDPQAMTADIMAFLEELDAEGLVQVAGRADVAKA